MVDLKAIANEVHQARLARLDAEAASSEVEQLIWHVQHIEPGRGRLCFFIDGFELEPAGPPN